MPHSSSKYKAHGLVVPGIVNIKESVANARESGFGFVLTSLSHQRGPSFQPLCDLNLKSSDWHYHVTAKITTDGLRTNSAKRFDDIDAEIAYAGHLGVSTLVFDFPGKRDQMVKLAQVINSKLATPNSSCGVWIQIPIVNPVQRSNQYIALTGPDILPYEIPADPWNQWNDLRTLMSFYTPRLGVALDLNGDLPDDEIVKRWAGEPVKAIIIHTSTFLTNNSGCPVLPKAYQSFLRLIFYSMAKKVFFLVQGPQLHKSMRLYTQYLDHLKEAKLPIDTAFAHGYEDFLQFPLQPLKDNLDSTTYEVFEKDPVKYAEYERAIAMALDDVHLDVVYTGDQENLITILVVGAGRGPLVEASISASRDKSKRVRIYVVEKNVNAFVTLKALQATRWSKLSHAKVEVTCADMRDYLCPHKADIVVSELLGSFSDNELSPECLDGVYASVKENAISIPQSYTSFIQPVLSPKIFNEVLSMKPQCHEKPYYYPFELNYVVSVRNVYCVDKPKAVFTFDHKTMHRLPKTRDNSRYTELAFKNSIDYTCHGFVGYFDCVLYKSVTLSTVPDRPTPGMFSWFPIYFPIIEPLFVPARMPLTLNMWRLLDSANVWYEWCVSSPKCSIIHNPRGRSHAIGLH